jgi:hypothetical protein
MAVKSDLPPRHVAWFDPKTGRPSSTFAAWAEATQKRLGVGTDDKVEVAAQSGEVAQAAADTANAAAATAQAAATEANTAASTAQTVADTATQTIALTAAFSPDVVITASADGATAKIVISDHTMIYPDKVVNVTGDTLTGLDYNTSYDIYYDDAGRVGGAVTFHAVTDGTAFPSPTNPNRIYVGTQKTPATSGDPDVPGVPRQPYGKNTSI